MVAHVAPDRRRPKVVRIRVGAPQHPLPLTGGPSSNDNDAFHARPHRGGRGGSVLGRRPARDAGGASGASPLSPLPTADHAHAHGAAYACLMQHAKHWCHRTPAPRPRCVRTRGRGPDAGGRPPAWHPYTLRRIVAAWHTSQPHYHMAYNQAAHQPMGRGLNITPTGRVSSTTGAGGSGGRQER
jgi:hypothetical protein